MEEDSRIRYFLLRYIHRYRDSSLEQFGLECAGHRYGHHADSDVVFRENYLMSY